MIRVCSRKNAATAGNDYPDWRSFPFKDQPGVSRRQIRELAEPILVSDEQSSIAILHCFAQEAGC